MTTPRPDEDTTASATRKRRILEAERRSLVRRHDHAAEAVERAAWRAAETVEAIRRIDAELAGIGR